MAGHRRTEATPSFGRAMPGHDGQLMPFRVPAQVPQTPSRPACFLPLLAPNRDREIGGGRATRQPGQVRKEAALTRSGSGRSSVSYLFFRANRAKCGCPRALRLILASARIPAKVGSGFATEMRASQQSKPAERQSIADRSMSDAGAPPTKPDSADQGGFELGAAAGGPAT